MSRYVRFHPEARLEVLEIAQRTDPVVVDALDDTIAQISLMPEAWPLWPGRWDVRQRVMTKWPHSILYSVDAASVFIVAVAHQRRAPGYWLSRL